MKKYYSFVSEKVRTWLLADEIENSPGLKLVAWCILVSSGVFLYWSNIVIGTRVFNTTCWPFFQNCQSLQNLFFFNSHIDLRNVHLPLILGSLCYGSYALLKNRYIHYFLALSFFYFLLLLPWFVVAGYHEVLFTYPEYYLFFIVSLFLFTPGYRFFFLQLFFILSYFLSAISKIGSDTWLLGLLPLPLIPQAFVPLFTNALLSIQLCIPLLLLSKNRRVRIGTFVALECFHLYSVNLAWMPFFLITSPFIFILFFNNYKEMDFRNVYRSLMGFGIILVLVFINFVRVIIPHNDYVTLEGSYYGFNMFQSYKGCHIEYADRNYLSQTISYQQNYGNQMCDPYRVLQVVKKNCNESYPDARNRFLKLQVNYTNKTYILVDTKDYCQLEYKAFSHNSWIDPLLTEDKTTSLGLLTRFFSANHNKLQGVYIFLFVVIFGLLLFKSIGRLRT